MRSWLKLNRGFLVFLACFGFFRLAIADWNPIPSGSMRPTLLEGDVVLVNRLAYDFKLPLSDIVVARLSDPVRGDIVTFASPRDGTRLIKRVVALPGDLVEMRDAVLWVNAQSASYLDPSATRERLEPAMELDAVQATERLGNSERRVQFVSAIQARRDFGPLRVPQGSYFVLGDNRDNSADSRYIGVVPRHLLIGRAHRVIVSANILGHWLPRLERTSKALH